MEGDNIDRARLLDRYTEALDQIERNIRETKHTDDIPKKPVLEQLADKASTDDDEAGCGAKAKLCQPCTVEYSTLKFKAFFFLFKGSKSCIVPFLPVYYQQLGLVASQIGLLQSCSPFTQIPLMMAITCLADRLNMRKTLIVISLVGWILGISLIALVPAPAHQSCEAIFARLKEEHKPSFNVSNCVTNATNALIFPVEVDPGLSSIPERTTNTSRVLDTPSYQPNVSLDFGEYLQTSMPIGLPPRPLNFSRDLIYAPLEQILPGTHRKFASRFTHSPFGPVHRIYSPYHFNKRDVNGSSLEDAVTLTEYDWLYRPADLKNLFIVFLLLSVFGSVFQGPVHALSNAAVLDSLYIKGNTVDYGYQKAFGPVGAAIGTLSMGAILSVMEHPTVLFGVEIPHTNYSVAFITFVVTMVLCLPLAFTFDAPPKPKDTSEFSVRVLVQVIFSAKYGSFLLASAWTGAASGLSSSFIFWYIMSVGGSHVIMGVAGLAALAAETATYFALPQLSRVTSHHTLMLGCLLLVVIRYFLYGIVRGPWLLVIPECFKGVSAAIVEYTLGAIFADEELVSYSCSLQGSFLLAYYAVGYGIGSILGGVVIDALGAVKSFFVVSLISLILSVLFLIIRSIRYGYEKLQD
ncbi:major facilitator superfamily domain-containing protein 6-like isoform X2 [Acanthaster planci]|nr:major facilitator superfamily domain-containing protein 6-like isoform X2 [Acanthaster planci]XP_022080065.1 major facilitator superfamily domain-containing protein 6-like isoform X2 [Acanthaster planci]XP_022080066.1 major facilitator superfamily domain-containing protein 6-like isoform X2 [Acanthaster planci]